MTYHELLEYVQYAMIGLGSWVMILSMMTLGATSRTAEIATANQIRAIAHILIAYTLFSLGGAI